MSHLDDIKSFLESREKEILKKYVTLGDKDVDELLESSQILRSGNGWMDEDVDVHYLTFRPIQPSTVITICEKNKNKPFGFLLKPKKGEISISDLYLSFIPYWWINAIFYCFYLRKKTYEIPVNPDVLGAIVDKKIKYVRVRSGLLTADRLSSEMYDEILLEKAKKLMVSDAVELAFIRKQISYVIGNEAPIESAENQIREYVSKYYEKSYIAHSVDEIDELGKDARKMNFNVSVEEASVDKKKVIKDLQGKVSKLPDAYKISETFLSVFLTLVYIPIYKCDLRHADGRVKTLYINGVTGKTFK